MHVSLPSGPQQKHAGPGRLNNWKRTFGGYGIGINAVYCLGVFATARIPQAIITKIAILLYQGDFAYKFIARATTARDSQTWFKVLARTSSHRIHILASPRCQGKSGTPSISSSARSKGSWGDNRTLLSRRGISSSVLPALHGDGSCPSDPGAFLRSGRRYVEPCSG